MTLYIRSLIGILLALALATNVHAQCVLPEPDGGAESPSPANVEGYVASIDKDIVVISIEHTKKTEAIRVSPKTGLYTAFGGDFDAKELKIGQKAWVWFVGCKRTKNSVPEAAYFQIFSKDPNDRP